MLAGDARDVDELSCKSAGVVGNYDRHLAGVIAAISREHTENAGWV